MAEVHLTWAEVMLAAEAGAMRQVQNMKEGRKHRYGADPNDGWKLNIEGAIGEMAVAKMLGLFWSGAIGNLKAADVGHIQVRTTTHPNGCLTLHPDDKDDEIFVNVIAACPDFHTAGWCYGREGKKQRFWKDPTGKQRHAYFVPQNVLRHSEIPLERNSHELADDNPRG